MDNSDDFREERVLSSGKSSILGTRIEKINNFQKYSELSRTDSIRSQKFEDIDKVLWANVGRRLTNPQLPNPIQNFETFSYTRSILPKPSTYTVVTHEEKIINSSTINPGQYNQQPNSFTTKNAFVQTVVEAKPRNRVVVAGKLLIIKYILLRRLDMPICLLKKVSFFNKFNKQYSISE